MKCEACEKAIFTYRELSDEEKQDVIHHLETCSTCSLLFLDVERVSMLLSKTAEANSQLSNTVHLTDRIMIRVINDKPPARLGYFHQLLELSISRYALAGASFCLLMSFFVELTRPISSQIKEPVANLQGIILNSESLRKGFAQRKEKKLSWLTDCTNPFNKNIDLGCLKEKIKINF